MNKHIMSRKELAEYLGCSLVTVDAEVKRGLPFFTIGQGKKRGGAKRFRLTEVDKWYNTQRELKK